MKEIEGIVQKYETKIRQLEDELEARKKQLHHYQFYYYQQQPTVKAGSPEEVSVAYIPQPIDPQPIDPLRKAMELAEFMKAQVTVTTDNGILMSVDRRVKHG